MEQQKQASQRMGGWAATLQGLLFILVILNLIVIQPRFFSQSDWVDPSKIQAAWPVSLIPLLLQILFSMVSVVLMLSFFERFAVATARLARLALIAGCIGSGLALLAAGCQASVIDVAYYPPADQIALVAPTISALGSIGAATRVAGFFALGWALILWAICAWQTSNLPGLLCMIMLLCGICGVLGVISYLFVLLQAPFYILWSFWLGGLLLRRRSFAAILASPSI